MPDYSKNYSDKSFWKKMAQVGKKIPFAREVLAMYYCMADKDTPLWAKAAIIAALGYFILPFDTIPDIFIPLGFTDDAAIIAATLSLIRTIMKDKHWGEADRTLANS